MFLMSPLKSAYPSLSDLKQGTCDLLFKLYSLMKQNKYNFLLRIFNLILCSFFTCGCHLICVAFSVSLLGQKKIC